MNYFSRRFGFLRDLLKFKNGRGGSLKFMTFVAASSLLVVSHSRSPVEAALEDSPKNIVDEVWQIVHSEFVDPEFHHVDWQIKRQELLQKDYTDQKSAYEAIRQSLKGLGDPYTRFLEPKEFDELTSQTSGELSGVGIRLAINEKTSQLTVVEPIPNSPASKAGIKAGDHIVRINDKPTELMSIDQASAEIKGEVGTEVSLQIVRNEKPPFDLVLERAQIELPSVTYNLNQEQNSKVGYIRLDEFSSHAAEQMQLAIEDLTKKQASGFVLDLRGNPGGLLFSGVEIARMWMAKGAIVSTIDRKGGNQKFAANGQAITNLPLVVLVDGYSASAS